MGRRGDNCVFYLFYLFIWVFVFDVKLILSPWWKMPYRWVNEGQIILLFEGIKRGVIYFFKVEIEVFSVVFVKMYLLGCKRRSKSDASRWDGNVNIITSLRWVDEAII